MSGSATTDRDGEFEGKAFTGGSVTDAFTAMATTIDQTCDSTVGVIADDEEDADHHDDDSDDDSDEGMCTADSSIKLVVARPRGTARMGTGPGSRLEGDVVGPLPA